MNNPDQSEPAAPAVVAPFERPVGRQAPERAEDGTPICPWCEQPVWDYCRSQYDTMTCVWRPLEGEDA